MQRTCFQCKQQYVPRLSLESEFWDKYFRWAKGENIVDVWPEAPIEDLLQIQDSICSQKCNNKYLQLHPAKSDPV